MGIYSEEVGHNREERIPFTLVMPYRKQRETNASKVNVIKKKGKKKKEKKKKAAAVSARDIELSKMVEYRASFSSAIISHLIDIKKFVLLFVLNIHGKFVTVVL